MTFGNDADNRYVSALNITVSVCKGDSVVLLNAEIYLCIMIIYTGKHCVTYLNIGGDMYGMVKPVFFIYKVFAAILLIFR